MSKKVSQKISARKAGFQRKYSDIFKEKGTVSDESAKKKNKKRSVDLEDQDCKPRAKVSRNENKAKVDSAKSEEQKSGSGSKEGDALPAENTTKKAGKKPRFILFVGNLSYTTTKEALEKHFKKAGPLQEVRLLLNAQKEPKGCAFVEYKTSAAMLNALLYHHTTFESRKINVEMTVGGGGNSSKRKKKIQEKRNKSNELIHKMLVQKKKSQAAIK